VGGGGAVETNDSELNVTAQTFLSFYKFEREGSDIRLWSIHTIDNFSYLLDVCLKLT